MDILSINQQVYIRRSDGRIHLAGIIKLDATANKIVTVEWTEEATLRGKDVPLQLIVKLNPQIFAESSSKKTTRAQPNAMASIAPRPARPTQLISQGVHNSVVPRLTAGKGALSAVVTATSRQPIASHPQDEIERLRLQRERRREQNAEARTRLLWYKNENPGNPNWQLARMIRLHRRQMNFEPLEMKARSPPKQHQILVCVRKRPLNQREKDMYDPDVISVPNQELLIVHAPRAHLNLTKFLEHHKFRFDYTFNEHCTNAQVYERTARPMVRHIFQGGMATCFAYGQTGSGKTHTMGGEFTGKQQNCRDGIYAMAAKDVFCTLHDASFTRLDLRVTCSFFELYASRVCDLLVPGKPQLRVLEDGHQQVQVVGLTEKPVSCTGDVLSLLEIGSSVRTSGHTSANSKSSRSHAVFQIVLRTAAHKRLHGKLSLIDLAGNERGADNCSADRLTRLEGSEINKSLLALKECIRALGRQSSHLPFRGSKLTQVLRDSFIGGKKVKTCMIAMISPGLHSVEHTLNTLRYADRVKELAPLPVTKAKLRPMLNVDNTLNGQTNSLPDIPSQANQLNRASSTTSLPEAERHFNAVQNDVNLEYFNKVTNY